MLMAVGEYEAAHNSMDDFAVPRGSEEELHDQHAHVERIFGVTMNILGVLTEDQLSLQSTGEQQMWVQLQGDKRNIVKAKDYIKGVCTPELTEDFSYPREMHCIFVGARGLFLDCLIRATSACVKPQTPGRIKISGLIEEVVMAQSRIHTFINENISKVDDQESSIKRNFKDLVEKHNDQHALDLLILPTSIKEQLLFLVEEDKDIKVKQPITHERIPIQTLEATMSKQPFFTAPVDFHDPKFNKSTSSHPMDISKSKSTKRVLRHRASEPHELITDSTWDSRQPVQLSKHNRPTVEENQRYTCSKPEDKPAASKRVEPLDEEDDDFKQISGLLDTIMGRDEREPGSQAQFSLGTQKEFNMLLDFFKTMGYQESVVLKVLHENGIQEPSEILDKVNIEQSSQDQLMIHKHRPSTLKGISHKLSSKDDEDDDEYLLEVMKSAAKNCGYSPSEIVDIGDGSVTGLLRKLNEKNSSEDFLMTAKAYEKQQEDLRLQQNAAAHSQFEPHISDLAVAQFNSGKHTTLNSNFPEEDIFNGCIQQEPVVKKEMVKRNAKEHNVPVVTGILRFNEAMQTPFKLNLRNEKGNDSLRRIIIDGSNVAMIHGLNQFFSCRGIALAVQYFWDRGHRDITVFVPQWRMKKDNKTKEQHFLTELNDVGLLSLTPSRTVEGKRITCYDDRFMLQLAEKTDGIIVTNDYLRDFFAESHAWQNIIKDRVLQYTFVGNIFMIPDDPLGRNGPPLDTFLTKNSLPKAKSKGHSFAGRRAAHAQSKPSSQTEVLNLRDRKPVGCKAREDTGVRSHKETERLRSELLSIFPSQDIKVDFILQKEPCLIDINKLSELIKNLRF